MRKLILVVGLVVVACDPAPQKPPDNVALWPPSYVFDTPWGRQVPGFPIWMECDEGLKVGYGGGVFATRVQADSAARYSVRSRGYRSRDLFVQVRDDPDAKDLRYFDKTGNDISKSVASGSPGRLRETLLMGASAARCKGAKFPPGAGWTQCRSLELTYGAGTQKQQLRWPRQDDDWRLLHAYFRTIDQAAVEWFAQEAQLWPPNAGLIPQSAGVVTDLTRLRCDGLFGDK